MKKIELEQFVDDFLKNSYHGYFIDFDCIFYYDPRFNQVLLFNMLQRRVSRRSFDVDYILSLDPKLDLQKLSDRVISNFDPNSKNYGIDTYRSNYIRNIIEEKDVSNITDFNTYKALIEDVSRKIKSLYNLRSELRYAKDHDRLDEFFVGYNLSRKFNDLIELMDDGNSNYEKALSLIDKEIYALINEETNLHEIIKNYI